MDSRLNKPAAILAIIVALVLGVVVGTSTGIADRIFGGPMPAGCTPPETSDQTLSAPNSVTPRTSTVRAAAALEIIPSNAAIATHAPTR